MTDQTPERLTVKEAAAYLRVGQGTVYALVNASRMEHYRIGLGRGTIRITKAALDALLREGRKQPAPTPGRMTMEQFLAS